MEIIGLEITSNMIFFLNQLYVNIMFKFVSETLEK